MSFKELTISFVKKDEGSSRHRFPQCKRLFADLPSDGQLGKDRFKGKIEGLCLVDLDGTFARKTLAPQFGKWLYRRGELSLTSMLKSSIAWWLYRGGQLTFEKLIETIVAQGLKRRSPDQLRALAELYAQSLTPSAFNEKVAAFIEQLRFAHLCVLTSRSPDFLVAAIAAAQGFDGWQATMWQSESATCKAIDGWDKARLCERLIAELKLDQSSVIALGDSEEDIPLLAAAGRAIAICPDRPMRARALVDHWEIWDR